MDHHPLVFSPIKSTELWFDAVGPEQVSAHYENFLMSRKYAFIYFGGIAVISFAMSVVDMAWIARSALIPWCMWGGFYYFIFEGKKSVLKPLLVRFYKKIAANEMHNANVSWHENMEIKIRKQLRKTKN